MAVPNYPRPHRAEQAVAWIAGHRKAILVALGCIAALIAAIGLLAAPGIAPGDAGGFSGSNSYGGGSSGGGGGYSGGSSSSSGGEGGFEDFVFVVIVMVIVVVVCLVKRGEGGAQPAGAATTPDSRLQSIEELKKRDPNFSASSIEELIAGVYVQMQQNWTRKDFEPMRPYFSNALFSQFSNQLEQMKRNGQTNYVDNIAVLETHVRGWYETQGNEYLVMKVRTRITDYTVVDATGAVVSGFKDKESFMEYEYVLSRTSGTKTSEMEKAIEAGQCPHCGAPINLVQNAKCEYCGSVIESKQHTWVIVAIKGVSQQIVG